MQLYYDPFVAFTLVDNYTAASASSNLLQQRVVAQAVNANDVILVFLANTFVPPLAGAVISGYVDFTPS